jgi:predicted transcriptional regulator
MWNPGQYPIREVRPLETLMGIFSSSNVVVIATDGHVEGILTKIDILDFLSSQV